MYKVKYEQFFFFNNYVLKNNLAYPKSMLQLFNWYHSNSNIIFKNNMY